MLDLIDGVGAAETGLREKDVARSHERHEVVRAAAITGIHEPGTVARRLERDAEAEARVGVGHASDRHAEGPDPPRAGFERCLRGEHVQEAGLAVQFVVASAQIGRRMEGHAAGRVRGVHQVVPQGHQVDVVIGMEVADQDGAQAGRLAQAGQVGEAAVAQVEQDRLSSVFDEVARRADPAPCVGRPGPDDGQPHRAGPPPAPAGTPSSISRGSPPRRNARRSKPAARSAA